MSFHPEFQLDSGILAVLRKAANPDRWLTSDAIAAELGQTGTDPASSARIEQRLILMAGDGRAECRQQGDTLVWRLAKAGEGPQSPPAVALSASEAIALQAVRRFSSPQVLAVMMAPLHDLFAAADARLEQDDVHGPAGHVAWHRKIVLMERSTPLAPPRLADSVLLPVLAALFEQRRLEVMHQPRGEPPRRRCVSPLGVVEQSGQVFLVALEDDDPQPVCIALSTVQSAEAATETFSYPDSFCLAHYVGESAHFGLRSSGPVPLVVRFRKGHGDLVRDAPLATDQSEEVRPDGSLVIRCTAEVNDRLVQWLRSLGSAVEVINPLPLRKQLGAEARRVVSIYFSR